MTLKFTYDEKRSGYWLDWDGHEKFGRITGDEEKTFLEFQDVKSCIANAWVSFELPKITLSNDVLETLFLRALEELREKYCV